ncbi:MAG: phytoene/squalene synthase family protein [Pirellulaceae bacterium]|nr:phytoene/squalene synthase family protein [Pirellulaceae bacterium]MDG2102675.1 phytoene/squalene synthase family protein [Pirellulaceae bacterium]
MSKIANTRTGNATNQPAAIRFFDELPDKQKFIEAHSKSFSLACRTLPQHLREDVCKLYAWCRWCDNAVDEAPDADIARQRLALLREDIESIYASRPLHLPASEWFFELVQRYDIPKQLPLDLLLGMESDIDFQPVQNQADLELYCYRAAGVVGLMMCRLLGVSDERAFENAKCLGIAMQLTNIARDVGEDWELGRLYLPATWLPAVEDLGSSPTDDQLRQAVEKCLDLADINYELGKQGYSALPAGTRLGIRVAAAVYREIGNEIKRSDYQVMQQRHFVSKAQKLKLVGREIAHELTFRMVNRRQQFGSHLLKKYPSLLAQQPSPSLAGEFTMKTEFHYLAIFGLSMTLVMATVLFALMGLNPKREAYELLPWMYSCASAIGAATLWLWSQHIGKQLDAAKHK